ncbi:phosphonate C-P lyase system protein PhnH [Pigmentiphaga aceris]|uniref:Phosphonate C-P lyase system protein PhnH n=2 Tax=Pigmentiphaga aceris TaxID=1940612 RepID=A0A5C0B6A1_9BURK|nr:phosphonate C-P lyase system protein PhnH [Pigmentiphaga aceris]
MVGQATESTRSAASHAVGSGAVDLSTLGAGFVDLARGSQAVFRTTLEALSHPGRPLPLRADVQAPQHGNTAAAVLLLALLDADCSLWLSPSLAAGDAGGWLRFHTGCVLVADASQAQFVWATHAEMPDLTTLPMGSEAYPDQSATCVIDVPDFLSVGDGIDIGAWVLRGPGIRGETRLHIANLAPATTADFLAQRAVNHASFPRGVDVFLASSDRIVGLPRSTQVSEV